MVVLFGYSQRLLVGEAARPAGCRSSGRTTGLLHDDHDMLEIGDRPGGDPLAAAAVLVASVIPPSWGPAATVTPGGRAAQLEEPAAGDGSPERRQER
jgi:hypothetical protein